METRSQLTASTTTQSRTRGGFSASQVECAEFPPLAAVQSENGVSERRLILLFASVVPAQVSGAPFPFSARKIALRHAVHHRDLTGRPAKAQRRDPQPDAESLAERYAMT